MNNRSLLYLSKKRTLFLGKLEEPLSMSPGAATLCLSMGAPIIVKPVGSNSEVSCTSVLIPPSCTVVIDSGNQLICNIHLDVMGEDLFNLSKSMETYENIFINLQNEENYRSKLIEIYQHAFPLIKSFAIIDSLLSFSFSENFKKEERAQLAVDIIQNSIDRNLSIEDLAKRVNLSVSGLTKIFKRQTGVPVRRYRQWHRLYTTATEIGKGKSLTEAALEAGFVDLPHCSHTFNTMLGMKPSHYLKKFERIKIFIQEDSKQVNLV